MQRHHSITVPLITGCFLDILPVHHVLLTCRHVALSLVQNQYSRHDFKVYVSALFATWSVVLPHPPLRNTYTYHSKYHIMYEFFNKITGLVAYYVLAVLRFSTSGSLCVLLHRCDGPLVLSSGLDRLLVPTGGLGLNFIQASLCFNITSLWHNLGSISTNK